MEYPLKTQNIPYQEIDNGGLILLLLREYNTFETLCQRYEYAKPMELEVNTNARELRDKLFRMKKVGLLSFDEEMTKGGKKPFGEIKITSMWSDIITALGGMNRVDFALLSRHSTGVATVPVFGRPRQPQDSIDIFVLMKFGGESEKLYTDHLRNMGRELGVAIGCAKDIFSHRPFMEKVWDGICAAKLIIADCTENNPNVFYEIGIAHTVGKKVILITRSETEIPSDIKHFDYIPYIYDADNVGSLIDKLKLFIRAELEP
jgi:hypothetical protein